MTQFTADRALLGLRHRGLQYRPDVRQPDGLWEAQCPRCLSYGDKAMHLSIREGRHGGPVTVSCRRRCPAESIIVNLACATEPASLEARVRRLELLVQTRTAA